ncbi:nickel transporter [Streptomyces sp. NPDC002004]
MRTREPRGRSAAARVAVLLIACAFVLIPAASAQAHPLGNFTVNRYDGLVAAPGTLRVDHVEDLAEIPATQARPGIARLGMARWARERCTAAARASRVTADGHRTALTVRASRARTRPGQAGLNTLRVECRWTAPLPKGNVALRFHAAVDSGPGWREVTARGDRATLTASDVPRTSVSGELTHYPKELLSSPSDRATASLRIRPGGAALVPEHRDAPASSVLPRGADRWTRALDRLVARHDLTPGFAALALGTALVLGALHALAPGHGKTLMAAAAAARGRASLRDVLPLAASVTVTHTLGVVALGLLVTAGSAAAPSVIAWLGMTSGVLVTLAGANLLRRAWRNRGHGHGHVPASPEGHGHEHRGGHGHSGESAHGHAHDREREEHVRPPDHDHAHAHGHPHPHDHHGEQAHGHEHGHDRTRAHGHAHAHGVEHSHGGFTHTHPVAPTLRGTILLGFAGGLVPSPSAVVVLVGAAALGKAWFGFLLVLAYGAGLALTLTAAGFAVVGAGDRMARALAKRPHWARGRAAALVRRTAPLGSALVVVALGAGLVFRGAASAVG